MKSEKGCGMNGKCIVSLALVIFATSAGLGPENAQASPLTSFTKASATGPFDSVVTGPTAGTIATATSPDTTIYYDPSIGYNAVGGTVSQVGGASALANLSVGQLRAGAGTTVHVTGFSIFGWSAYADLGDTLFFSNPGASASQTTTVGFSIHITGTLGDIPEGTTTSSGQPDVQFGLLLGPVGGLPTGTPSGFSQSAVNLVNPVSLTREWGGPLGTLDQTLTGTFQFQGTAAIIPLLEYLDVSGQYGFADITHTATFSFDALPDGVSYTSASGEFLTGGVPEPSTWAMMMIGFASLGFAGYKQVRRRAIAA
jgi:PEP-CTERM motif-containing protein